MVIKYIKRAVANKVISYLDNFPAVAILGPRQAGKSTLAKNIVSNFAEAIYLDLETASDRQKVSNPEIFFEQYKNNLICLDEIQRAPELFTSLRGIIDANARNGQFLILGSASQELIRQSSESLAGRIAFIELSPFLFREIEKEGNDLYRYWTRGGFPRSYLASSDEMSFTWRENFVQTFLERDIPQLGPRIPAETLRRFWTMLAHLQGSRLNAARLGGGLGVSGQTVARYTDLLVDLLLLRRLAPVRRNVGKRLVKSPKV